MQDTAAATDAAAADAKVSDAKSADAAPADPTPTAAEWALLDAFAKAGDASKAQGEAIWPGYALHQVGAYLVVRVDASHARGFLVRPLAVPNGAIALAGHADTYRYDAQTKGLLAPEDSNADLDVAGKPAVAVVVPQTQLANIDTALRLLGTVYFDRLRFTEQNWPSPASCGQTKRWSNNAEARALMFGESAALHAAMLAGDPSETAMRLNDFAQFRARARALDPMVKNMYDAHESSAAASQYGAERLLAAMGRQSLGQLDAAIAAGVHQALDAPMAQMVPVMQEHANFAGMALIRVGQWLKWDYAAPYLKGQTVGDAALDKAGGPSEAKLAEAKKRYDWAKFDARAQQLGAATDDVQP